MATPLSLTANGLLLRLKQMRELTGTRFGNGFTLMELAVAGATIAILVLVFATPTGGTPRRSERSVCQNRLKRIGLAVFIWSQDHGARLPPEVSVTNRGSMELVGTGSAAAHFQVLASEMGRNWDLCVSHR